MVPAFEGDTVASALLANGIHLVGRSFKYHRPRGILGHGVGGAERAARRSTAAAAGAIRTTAPPCVEAFDGLALARQNHWPSLRFDVGAVNDALVAVFVAGFYYKTFMWPRGVLGACLRAGDPRGGRSRPRADGARSRPLHAAPRPLRRAGRRRRPGRPRGGAGGIATAGERVILVRRAGRDAAARCCTT